MIIFFRHPRKGAMIGVRVTRTVRSPGYGALAGTGFIHTHRRDAIIGVRVTRTVRSFGLASASPRPFGRLDIASLRERGSFIPTVGTP